MFDELSAKLTAALQKLTGRGVLTEEAVKDGLREIRRVLLEADVSFDLTREFLERVERRAVGAQARVSSRGLDALCLAHPCPSRSPIVFTPSGRWRW